MKKASLRQAILVIAATFFCGFVAGVVLQDGIEELPLPFFASDRDYDDDLEDVIDSEKKLLRKLELSSDQRQRIDAAFARRENTLVDYWAYRIPEMERIIESSRAELRGLLTAEQRARYDQGLNEILRSADQERD